MMPIAFASLMGGMLTLIGTPPNLIVSEELVAQGYEPFRFHSFTPIGLIILAAGILYLLTLGQKLLSAKGQDNDEPTSDSRESAPSNLDMLDTYGLRDRVKLAKVRSG